MTMTFADISRYPSFERPYGPLQEAWYVCDNPKHDLCYFYVSSQEAATKWHRDSGTAVRGCRVRLYRGHAEDASAAAAVSA